MIEIDSVAVTDHNGDAIIHLENLEEGVHHAIHVGAVASWSELLGYADPVETLEAILKVREEELEPEPDWSRGGENVWTDAYTLLRHREQAREAEAFRAREEGTQDDPRSPLLRSTLAAYKAVHEPVGDGECVMDRCRRTARERMGLPEPSRKAGSNSRGKNVATERGKARATERIRAGGRSVGPGAKAVAEELDPNRLKIREAVDLCEDLIGPSTHRFLHSLTDNEEDPLAEPEPTPDSDEPLRDIFQKYGGQQ